MVALTARAEAAQIEATQTDSPDPRLRSQDQGKTSRAWLLTSTFSLRSLSVGKGTLDAAHGQRSGRSTRFSVLFSHQHGLWPFLSSLATKTIPALVGQNGLTKHVGSNNCSVPQASLRRSQDLDHRHDTAGYTLGFMTSCLDCDCQWWVYCSDSDGAGGAALIGCHAKAELSWSREKVDLVIQTTFPTSVDPVTAWKGNLQSPRKAESSNKRTDRSSSVTLQTRVLWTGSVGEGWAEVLPCWHVGFVSQRVLNRACRFCCQPPCLPPGWGSSFHAFLIRFYFWDKW